MVLPDTGKQAAAESAETTAPCSLRLRMRWPPPHGLDRGPPILTRHSLRRPTWFGAPTTLFTRAKRAGKNRVSTG